MNSRIVSSIFVVLALGILIYDVLAGERVAPWILVCPGLLVAGLLVNIFGGAKTVAAGAVDMQQAGAAEHKSDWTWSQVFGFALALAGVSESFRNLRRVMEGEDAFVSLAMTALFALAGIWLIRKSKKQ